MATKKDASATKSRAKKTASVPKKGTLVIVESPAKAKTIENFLGSKYKVKASFGHLRDLPKSKMGVNIENDFEPEYTTIRGKASLIKELKEASEASKNTILATDPDREGEAISWHIAGLLDIDPDSDCRIEFNEITKDAVTEAIKNPRKIDMDLVNSQQTRRILDRIVGYKLSPVLWRKVMKGLSAGRVQSAALKIICDREKEISDFVAEEYWTINVLLQKQDDEKIKLPVKFYGNATKKIALKCEEDADAVCEKVRGKDFTVSKLAVSSKKKKPFPPFITSTLQQDAMRKLNFTAKKTMMIAQTLYEGVKLGSKTVGLITYMRTDSRRISKEAQESAIAYIAENYGKEYVPAKPNIYTSSKNAQDAHEAIRPTYIENDPASIKKYLTNDQYRLYKLIYERFLASQMASAEIETVTYTVMCEGYQFRSSGSRVLFKGHLKVYDSRTDEEKDTALPKIDEGTILKDEKLEKKQNFTQPPSRYNEASLIKYMEEQGIGRPSTYATIVSTIQDRGYVVKEKKCFVPTELGGIVNEYISKWFSDIVDVKFTSRMETKLDSIENGGSDWVQILKKYYASFDKELQAAMDGDRVSLPVEETDVICDKCGAKMVVRHGKFGKFLACPNFPKCRNTKPIVDKTGVKCPKCGGDIIARKGNKTKKTFYGCENYPKCDFVAWYKPLKENCPECGCFMMQTGRGRKQCANPDCVTNKKDK